MEMNSRHCRLRKNGSDLGHKTNVENEKLVLSFSLISTPKKA